MFYTFYAMELIHMKILLNYVSSTPTTLYQKRTHSTLFSMTLSVSFCVYDKISWKIPASSVNLDQTALIEES